MTEQHTELAYLHGKPQGKADLRTQNSDFKVVEILPFTPTGEGEHVFLYVRKEGANTVYVQKKLAAYFNVKPMHVSYAGLKDRNAVTEQYFGVHLPGKQQFELNDFNDLDIEGVKVLAVTRHNKKLKTGALLGNKFEIVLRNITDLDELQQRWQQLLTTGVPNYFGEQRFGREGNNLQAAETMFSGKKVKDKKKRSFYLSAARSYLFNKTIEQRIVDNVFDKPVIGDVFMLSGSRSIFAGEAISDEIIERLQQHEISITAPLWGAGELLTQQQAKKLELAIATKFQSLADGLVDFGLKQERRSIKLLPESGLLQPLEDSVRLTFFLPAGCFATTILRELVQYTDVSLAKNIGT